MPRRWRTDVADSAVLCWLGAALLGLLDTAWHIRLRKLSEESAL